MKNILLAHSIPPYFSLIESLNWIAFCAIPLSFYEQSESIIDEIFEYPRNAFISENQIGWRAGLDKLYVDLPKDDAEEINFENIATENEARRELNRREKKNAEFRQEYNDVMENYLAPIKSELFLKLKSGELKAYGHIGAKLKKGYIANQWQNKNAWEHCDLSYDLLLSDLDMAVKGNKTKDFVVIPSQFWHLDGIEWDENTASSRLGYYDYIFVESEILFNLYPFPPAKIITIEERGGYHFELQNKEDANSTNLSPINKRGRPPYNWPEFHVEVARYLVKENGKLPKQESLESHMAKWCVDNWGSEPSHGAIHPHISPYYSVFEKVKKS